ncbi:MAG: SAM-dependent chlorinase/fluorinase [Planctomycetota bacterium]
MTSPSGIITLLTDFGLMDPYVGVMKGAILGVFGQARIVDLTHEIPAQQVAEANFALRGSFAHFPQGTVHVVVVDPGVGSDRRIVCACSEGMTFLAPNNGVLTGIVRRGDPVFEVVNRELFLGGSISQTFHGRDVLAPVAAHLASGTPPEQVGPAFSDLLRLDLPEPSHADPDTILGQVIHVDRFGNLITNIRVEDLLELEEETVSVTFRGQEIGQPVDSYAAVPTGATLAVVDSFGFLEIAVNRGSASNHFNATRGDRLKVEGRRVRGS